VRERLAERPRCSPTAIAARNAASSRDRQTDRKIAEPFDLASCEFTLNARQRAVTRERKKDVEPRKDERKAGTDRVRSTCLRSARVIINDVPRDYWSQLRITLSSICRCLAASIRPRANQIRNVWPSRSASGILTGRN